MKSFRKSAFVSREGLLRIVKEREAEGRTVDFYTTTRNTLELVHKFQQVCGTERLLKFDGLALLDERHSVGPMFTENFGIMIHYIPTRKPFPHLLKV